MNRMIYETLDEAMAAWVPVFDEVRAAMVDEPLAGQLTVATNIVRWTALGMAQDLGYAREHAAGVIIMIARGFADAEALPIGAFVVRTARAVASDEFTALGTERINRYGQIALEAAERLVEIARNCRIPSPPNGPPVHWLALFKALLDACGTGWRDQVAEIAALIVRETRFPSNAVGIPEEVIPGKLHSSVFDPLGRNITDSLEAAKARRLNEED